MKEEETKAIKQGKPWNVAATFNSFKEADEFRTQKLLIWEENSKEGMQIKVRRRRSDERFVVKIRLHPDFEPKLEKKEKKRGKGKKKGRKTDRSDS